MKALAGIVIVLAVAVALLGCRGQSNQEPDGIVFDNISDSWFQPNAVITDEEWEGGMEAYIDGNHTALHQVFPEAGVTRRDDTLYLTRELGGGYIYQEFHFRRSRRGKRYEVLTMSRAEEDTSQDAVFRDTADKFSKWEAVRQSNP